MVFQLIFLICCIGLAYGQDFWFKIIVSSGFKANFMGIVGRERMVNERNGSTDSESPALTVCFHQLSAGKGVCSKGSTPDPYDGSHVSVWQLLLTAQFPELKIQMSHLWVTVSWLFCSEYRVMGCICHLYPLLFSHVNVYVIGKCSLWHFFFVLY